MIVNEIFKQKYLNSELKYYSLLYFIPLLLLFDLSIVTVIFLIIVFLYFLTLNNRKIFLPDFLVWTCLIFWGFYIIFISPEKSTGFLHFSLIILSPFLIFFLILNIADEIFLKFLQKFLNYSIIAGCVLSIYSIFVFYELGFKFSMRIPSFWKHYNLVAAFFMLLIIFNVSILVYNKNAEKKFYILSLILLILGLILTQTRAVLIAVFVSMVIFILKKPRLILPFFIFSGIVILLFSGIFSEKLSTVVNFYADISTLGRIQAWLTSIELIKQNVFFGYGFNSYIKLRDTVFSNYFVITNHSHSTYLGLFLEMGLIGFCLYFYFYIKAIIYSVKLRKTENEYSPYIAGLQSSLITLLIIFFFEPYFTPYGAITIFIWFLISISFKIYYINLKTT